MITHFNYQGLRLSRREDGDWDVTSLTSCDDGLHHWGAPPIDIILERSRGFYFFGHLALTQVCEALTHIVTLLSMAMHNARWINYATTTNTLLYGCFISVDGTVYRRDGTPWHALPDAAVRDWWSPLYIRTWLAVQDDGPNASSCRPPYYGDASLLDLVDQATYNTVPLNIHEELTWENRQPLSLDTDLEDGS